MCGIFGWIKKRQPFKENEIFFARRALSSMSHRGPDFQVEWQTDSIYLGHRRLSIIDLSAEANQPFWDENKKYVILFNGEIYNYLELKDELQKKGVKFFTSSDTEVLLKAFMFWGKDAFLRSNGMFACSIHDTTSGKHYIFRDHLGQKPLYYYEYHDGIIYASELRALLSIESFNWRLDRVNFLKFLLNSYYSWDTTPLVGVKKLLPGHYLEISDGKVRLGRFWDSLPGDKCLDITFQEAILEFQRLLDKSCEITMRSDVPFGVFLSGGVDSSLILDSCHRLNPEISSYTVSMGEDDFDEWGKAKVVADHLKIKSINSYLMDSYSVQDSLDAFFSFSDEPHGDPGFVNSYFLAKSCKPDITVAIAGDGADELFAGYVPFLALEKENLFRHFPEFAISGIKRMIQDFIPGNDKYLGLQFKSLSFLQGFPANDLTRFPLWLSAISPEELQKLCPWQESVFFFRMGEKGTIFEDFQKVLSVMEEKSRKQMLVYFYQKFFLPEFVCMHTDRAAMQNSLEVRSPFLSVPLIEFANQLPDNFKMEKGELKRILRYVMRQRGFSEIICKQKKHGFTFPVARWLKTALKHKMDKMLSRDRWRNGLIDISYMEYLKKQHLEGKRNNYRILFNLMVFCQWLEKYPQVLLG